MAGLVPIQVGNATNGQAGALASAVGSNIGFAAALLCVFNQGNTPKTPSEVGSLDPGSGVARSTSAAVSSDLWPITPPDGSDTSLSAGVKSSGSPQVNAGDKVSLPAKSSVFGLLRSIQGGATTSPATTHDSRGTLTPQSGPEGSVDEPAPEPEPLRSEGNVQNPPEDAGSITTLVSDPGLASSLANEGFQGETAARHLPAKASGKNSDIGSGNHIKGHRPSDETAVPSIQAGVSQVVPDGASITFGFALPPPAATASVPTAGPPPLSDATGATAPQVNAAAGVEPANPHRAAPAAADTPQSGSRDHAADATLLSAESSIASDQEKTVRSDAVPETPALPMRAEVPQPSSSGAAALAPSGRDHERSVVPADQIAPAVVGILQKPDGQQSVTVRLQPAELGQVQIRVDQTVAGAAHIAITAERPETLQLLQRDEPRLQQVLDQAGMQSTGRTVSFQVSAPEQVGAAAARPDSMETGGGAFGQGQSGGAWRQQGDTPNDFGRNPEPGPGQNRTRWFRAGLDITA